MMTPQEFIAKWQPVTLSECSACQQHFLDLCDLLGQPKPAAADPEGAWYTFERGVKKTEGGQGWADVWMKGKFGWEYKGKHKDLKVAYQQLLKYRNALENPPLLVVCDMDRFEVHTNFTGTAEAVHAFDLAGLADPKNLDILRKVFTNPEALRPGQTQKSLTEHAAERFATIADRKEDTSPVCIDDFANRDVDRMAYCIHECVKRSHHLVEVAIVERDMCRTKRLVRLFEMNMRATLELGLYFLPQFKRLAVDREHLNRRIVRAKGPKELERHVAEEPFVFVFR